MSDTGIVTPEAVVLAFDTAGVGSRLIAIVLDLTAQFAAFVALAFGFSIFGRTPFGLVGVFVGLFAIAFVYPIAIETLWHGKSLGKAAMGLRVVTVEGAPIRFRHALVRGALGLVDFWMTSGAAAVLAVLLTPRNQRLGDLAAGTLVLRERTGARQPSAATFYVPPGWERYAETLDVSGLTAVDYQAVRAFLLRAASLDPSTRDRLARQIATPLLARLRHQPPGGVSAEAFCVCVAARYQQRQRGAATPATWPQPGWPAPAPAPQPGWPAPAPGWPAPAPAPGWPAPLPVMDGLQPGEPAWQGDATPARPGGRAAPEAPPPESGGFSAPG